MNRTARLARAFAFTGVAIVVAGTLLAGAAFPDYSHARQYISELGAHGAPHGGLVTYGMFLPAGIAITAFAWQASRVLPRSPGMLAGMLGVALYAFGYLNSVPFRCDFGCRPDEPSTAQVLHTLVGGLSYLAGAIALLVLGFTARRWPRAGVLAATGIAGGILSLLAFPALSEDFAFAGLAQRLVEASMLGWILLCARYLGRPAAHRAGAAASAAVVRP